MRADLKKYALPMHVAAALSTGRVELLKMGPVNLNEDAQREMLRLLCDLITDRKEMESKIEELRQAVKMTVQTSEGQLRKLTTIMDETVELTV